jgi:hypothetical protein
MDLGSAHQRFWIDIAEAGTGIRYRQIQVPGEERYRSTSHAGASTLTRLSLSFVFPSAFPDALRLFAAVYFRFPPGSRFLIVSSPRDVLAVDDFSFTFQGTRKWQLAL